MRAITQRLERRTHNPLVPDSSSGGPTRVECDVQALMKLLSTQPALALDVEKTGGHKHPRYQNTADQLSVADWRILTAVVTHSDGSES